MSTQTIDYSTLTDRELDVEIAKRLGLTFRDWDGLEICEVHDGVAHWVFKSYATDANAALELVKDDNDYCITPFGFWEVKYETYHHQDSEMIGFATNKSCARAICECWLQVQDAKR